MSMSDKEFDQMFKDRFDMFELDPSPGMWANIEQQLNKRGGTRQFPYLSVAAASLAIVILGLWLAPDREHMKLHASKQVAQAEILEKPENTSSDREESTISAPLKPENRRVTSQPSPERVAVNEPKVQPLTTETDEAVENVSFSRLAAEQPSEALDQATESSEARTAALAYTPNQSTYSIADYTEVDEPAAVTSRKRIKTVGDIVNFVVGKVDKRNDKIIEFKNEEEGNVVSGINLGVLQFKNKQK